jgi:hypothetical protein
MKVSHRTRLTFSLPSLKTWQFSGNQEERTRFLGSDMFRSTYSSEVSCRYGLITTSVNVEPRRAQFPGESYMALNCPDVSTLEL